WVEASKNTFALMSSILSIVNPAQYRQGLRCMRRLGRKEAVKDSVGMWGSVFNAVTVLANRESLFHRDGSGRFEWFDMLATYGRYTDGQLSLPAAGLDLHYRPGTVVPFCGNVLRHGVPHCNGERICLAYYMRHKLHVQTKTGPTDWAYSSDT
ncbi:hypothetical protein CONPUDRAFT_46538, partial [Coniophora puteana RWD-64-598 SS2]